MRISDWSSDVCSSDLCVEKPAFYSRVSGRAAVTRLHLAMMRGHHQFADLSACPLGLVRQHADVGRVAKPVDPGTCALGRIDQCIQHRRDGRSEEHTSELQSLMRIPSAAFCLKTKTTTTP